ncbi:MAG TPA: SgcJ/EcaC family oxidoreductase [Gemmatimonadales bacterium]|nr:SgcJ/EcaC family oxidoreductase [Gemmatimonadales bacterium]
MVSRALALALLVAACRPSPREAAAPLPDADSLTAHIAAQLARSAAAWNRGELDGFMVDYATDSATSYVARGRVVRGVEAIRNHYARYFADGAARDSLRFEALAARPLAPRLALVTARWVLHRGDSVTASGPFTLIMERRGEGWKIIHDHSSSD